MNTAKPRIRLHGFTLMELMVAMAVTTIIVGILVSITGSAIDTWNRGRSELRAARQAKAMVDVMANDLESFVTRNMSGSEWLSAKFDTETDGENSNASYLVFFTATTDRYEGDVGVEDYVDAWDNVRRGDLGGDVSCVGYRLRWRDPIGTDNEDEFGTFTLNRLLVDPKSTFRNLLGQTQATTLASEFESKYDTSTLPSINQEPTYNINEARNFLCENIYQFTVTFMVEAYHQPASGTPQLYTVPVSVGSENGMTETFRVLGDGMVIESASSMQAVVDTPLTADELQAGRLSSVEVSITVMSDNAINLLRRNNSLANDSDWVAKNTYNYSKLVMLPKM